MGGPRQQDGSGDRLTHHSAGKPHVTLEWWWGGTERVPGTRWRPERSSPVVTWEVVSVEGNPFSAKTRTFGRDIRGTMATETVETGKVLPAVELKAVLLACQSSRDEMLETSGLK